MTKNYWTAQKVFDRVVTHLLQQRATSKIIRNGREICAYRGKEGRKCAFGCLIKKDEYRRSMEGKLPETIIQNYGLIRFSPFKELIIELQTVHDAQPIDDWRKTLKQVCNKFNLTWNNN